MERGNSAGNSANNGASAANGNGPGMGSAVVPESVDQMSGDGIRSMHWWWV